MRTNLLQIFTLAIIINSVSSVACANQKEQMKLDNICEASRQVALQPRKKEIYQECRQKFKKSESVCQSEADVFNGNRPNGAPLFYELPACEKAFNYRNKHTK